MAKNYQSISTSDDKGDIRCPFLKMTVPEMKNIWTFCADCNANGLSWFVGLPFVFFIAMFQLGFWKAIIGTPPDMYRLEQIPGVSHEDLFHNYFDETIYRINAAKDSDGMIMLQDIVNIKKWIAEQEGIQKSDMLGSSTSETGLVFLAAGGDLVTQKVSGEEVIKVLKAERPTKNISITVLRFLKVNQLMIWE